MPIRHAKQSGLPADEGNPAHVEPSDWYADHVGTADDSVVFDRAPSNGSTGLFQLDVPDDLDGVTGGTFTLIINGEETAPIVWDALRNTLRDNILAAINALPGINGLAFLD